jgi:hypothetical protein
MLTQFHVCNSLVDGIKCLLFYAPRLLQILELQVVKGIYQDRILEESKDLSGHH